MAPSLTFSFVQHAAAKMRACWNSHR